MVNKDRNDRTHKLYSKSMRKRIDIQLGNEPLEEYKHFTVINYIKFRVNRSICHAVQFKEPVSQEDFEWYVKVMKYWDYHPAGYGGHSYKGAKENEWIWSHSWSCD